MQTATSTTIGGVMNDIAIVAELAAGADSQVGDLLITGLALIDLADEAAIHQILVWVGRTSTQPTQTDRGVRTRQYAANAQGLPYVMRIRGLRIDVGDQMKLVSFAIAETNASVVHQNVVSVKWSFRELAQG